MPNMTVTFRNLPGTEAALGLSGGHTVIVDRPEGRAGGMGLGFSGGQLLAIAIGGCFCNDLRYVAHDLGVRIAEIEVTVTIDFEGAPLIATGAELTVDVRADDPAVDVADLVRRTYAISAVANSVSRGVPIRLRTPGG